MTTRKTNRFSIATWLSQLITAMLLRGRITKSDLIKRYKERTGVREDLIPTAAKNFTDRVEKKEKITADFLDFFLRIMRLEIQSISVTVRNSTGDLETYYSDTKSQAAFCKSETSDPLPPKDTRQPHTYTYTNQLTGVVTHWRWVDELQAKALLQWAYTIGATDAADLAMALSEIGHKLAYGEDADVDIGPVRITHCRAAFLDGSWRHPHEVTVEVRPSHEDWSFKRYSPPDHDDLSLFWQRLGEIDLTSASVAIVPIAPQPIR